MSDDLATHLQAFYHSGQIARYIHSRLPDGSLKTGWIEQGLLSKGLKGTLRDKNNQESLVIPADRFARLTRDLSGWKDAALVIIGPKGLATSKFVSIVFEKDGFHSLLAYETKNVSPHEIIRFLVENVLGMNLSKSFEEPNLDYIEQLVMDNSKGSIDDTIVLTLPKKQVKISDWLKESLLSPSSENVELQYGNSNALSKFAALMTRWLTGLELFKKTSNGIAALVFLGDKSTNVCLWDQPQRKAVFSTFKINSLEELSQNYLLPLWLVPGERVATSQQKREVTVETRRISGTNSSVLTPTKAAEERLALISKRLDSIELQLKASTDGSNTSVKDSGSLDVLQTRLSENIERIDALSRRLAELEKRIRKIRS